MLLSAFKDALYNWAAPVVGGGVQVYWGEPNGPRPPNPSVRFKLIMGPSTIGMDELRDVDGNPNDFTIVGSRSMMLSINAYGDQSQQIISDLQTSIYDQNKIQSLDVAGVGILSFSSVRDLSQLLETKIEQRYQVDANLLVTEAVTTQPGVIEHVEVNSTISHPGGEGTDIDGEFESDKT